MNLVALRSELERRFVAVALDGGVDDRLHQTVGEGQLFGFVDGDGMVTFPTMDLLTGFSASTNTPLSDFLDSPQREIQVSLDHETGHWERVAAS